MVVSTSNLVDSNVFIRSLVISLEREKYRKKQRKLIMKQLEAGEKPELSRGRSYLTHSWWDVESIPIGLGSEKVDKELQFDFGALEVDGANFLHDSDSDDDSDDDEDCDDDVNHNDDGANFLRSGDKDSYKHPNEIWLDDIDWFDDFVPAKDKGDKGTDKVAGETSSTTEDLLAVGPMGWKFSPERERSLSLSSSSSQAFVDELAFEPNTMSRVSWFLVANQTRLLRELMRVVSLHNVNHENICVLNTVIVFFIFINRKGEGNLARVLHELRVSESTETSGLDGPKSLESGGEARDDEADIAALDDLDNYDHTATPNVSGIMVNFRELLFFWREYYTHRGRDRLSLEFSSHLRFVEWKTVVDMLCADDGSPHSLVAHKINLPRSPYSRAPRST